MLEFRILGALEVVRDGRVLALPQPKARALLAYLVLHANELVPADVLVDAVWGEQPPKTVLASLQNYVSRLRKALGAEALVSRPPGYVLEVEPDRIDLRRAERLIAEARGSEGEARAAKLREALSLWRGPALADLLYEPFAHTEAPRLEELRLTTLEDRIDAELALGHGAELVGELEGVVTDHPLRERFRGQLMVALYRAGRQADALEAYQRARATLVDELGIEPSPALRRLEAAILRQDDSLGPVRGVPARVRHAPGAPTAWRRRTVSVLFAELASTADPEAVRGVAAGLLGELRNAVTRHGGVVHELPGDAAMAVFGVPSAHEDDALRAVRAAAEIGAAHEALGDRSAALELRIGVNTGEVLASAAEEDVHVSGEPVVIAKRLAELAPPGEILLTPSTFALVRGAVVGELTYPAPIQGRAEPMPVFRLVRVLDDTPALARALATPLVGREPELAALRREFDAARGERRCRLVALVGEPGIGKTRLARELAAVLADDATVMAARCPSYGSGATYLPLADLVAQATGGDQSQDAIAAVLPDDEQREVVARRIAELIGVAEGAAAGGDAFWAVRRFVEALARDRPLVLVLEDLHWAEATFLDLIESVRDRTAGAAVLLLATGRPELLEARSAWAESAVRLEPLGELDAHVLIDHLVAADVPASTRFRVVESAEGNPLFVEQLLAFAAEDDGITALPPTLEALIASRLDRLAPGDRAVLERAAVAGREFRRGGVVALSPADEAPSVGRRLSALADKGFVHTAPSALGGEDAYRFHHALIRDVAYAGIPKAARAELHERLADWLDERAPGIEELVGSHLEEAFRLRSELGQPGRATHRLAADAGVHLGRAGIRAFKRGDIAATLNLLERATRLLPEEDAYRRELLCELGLAHRTGGDLERAAAVLVEAVETSERHRDRRAELRARMELAFVRLFTDPHGRAPELVEVTEKAIPTFEAVADDRALGRAWLLVGLVRGTFENHHAAHEAAAERSLAHYVRTGWPPAYARGDIGAAMFHGPRPADDALGRCYELLDEAVREGPVGEAHLSAWAGGLHSMRGELSTARERIEHARGLFGELGHAVSASYLCEGVAVFVDVLAGELAEAERRLRALCELARERHESAILASSAADLSHVLQDLGHEEEAAEWLERAKTHAAQEDAHAQYRTRSAEARLLARRGDAAEAVTLAREAVELAARTDALNARGDVLLALADVLGLAGDDDGAMRATEEATSLYERKGNVVSAERARTLLRPAALAE